LGPPGGEGKGTGREGGEGIKEGRERKGGRGGQGNGERMRREGKGGERGGPQFKENDPPSSNGWLRACYINKYYKKAVLSHGNRAMPQLILSV